MRMNRKIKKLWLKALRSGEYQQARGRMRVSKRSAPNTRADAHVTDDKTAHCCLGVLTEIALREGIIQTFETSSRRNSMPCMAVRNWAELDKRAADNLAGKNDASKVGASSSCWPRNNFAAIADYIEREL